MRHNDCKITDYLINKVSVRKDTKQLSNDDDDDDDDDDGDDKDDGNGMIWCIHCIFLPV